MADSDAAEVEREVRRLGDAGNFDAATTAAIRGYGPEILGFLGAQHGSDDEADEVFSLWSERVHRGLPDFGWTSSLRTWAYAVARNASHNHVRDRAARGRREQVDPTAEVVAVAQAVRTETPPYLRSRARDTFAAIREALIAHTYGADYCDDGPVFHAP